jgi:nickel/cobalt transporter (NicO) family protein
MGSECRHGRKLRQPDNGDLPVTRAAKTRLVLGSLVLALAVAAIGREALAQTSPLAAMRQPMPSGWLGWIMTQQALFYRELAGLIRAAKTDGTALWGLMGISFVYGIFHAAGPGHGKAVISSYLVANEETWRRGVTLSFASALLQALTAVLIVGVAAVLIGATAKAMGDTVRVIETVSYALIVLVGVRLLWVKGRAFLRALRAARSEPTPAIVPEHDHGAEQAHQEHAVCCDHDHAHHEHAHHEPAHHEHAHSHAAPHAHDNHAHNHGHAHRHDHPHDHAHDHDDENVLPWGHAHGPDPDELAGPGGWRRGLTAIVAVGLRPCSGAIIVLVFALAQGLFWAGVASTFVMGIGTAITVAAIATLAVGARTVAKRFAATRAGYGVVALRAVEVGAAGVVIAFGALLLTGTIASERMGMF